MKNIGVYTRRFYLMETLSYFILAVPWLPEFFQWGALPYGAMGLIIKICLSVAVLVFIFYLRDVRKNIYLLDVLRRELSMSAIHDLKGPLTSIIGTLSIVSDPDIDPKTKEELFKVAVESSQSMVKLIQTLVDTERMEVAKMIIQRQKLDLGAHMREYLRLFDSISGRLGVKLEISIPAGLPPIYADKDLLGRVYENLILNAFKYSRREGEISLRVSRSEGNFLFEVRDTGAGISPEHIERIFDKYYRVQGQENESRKGSGLGLYFCRLAVEAHAGKIWAESEKGKSTSIFFTIPQN